MEFLRRIYENGKITVPKEVREFYQLKEGDLVKLTIIRVYPSPKDAGDAQSSDSRPAASTRSRPAPPQAPQKPPRERKEAMSR